MCSVALDLLMRCRAVLCCVVLFWDCFVFYCFALAILIGCVVLCCIAFCCFVLDSLKSDYILSAWFTDSAQPSGWCRAYIGKKQ